MSGLTPTGFEVPTIDEIRAEMAAALRAAIDPALDTGPTSVMGQLIGILSEREHDQWIGQRDVWQAFSVRGEGVSLTQLALITGTVRREATVSRVAATVTLNAGVTLPGGSRGGGAAELTAVFDTVADVTNGGGSPAALPVVMTSVDPGPVRANAGTLTVIVTPVSGWTAVTNAEDAQLGLADEIDSELRARREAELRVQGSANLDAIISDVLQVDGVEDVAGEENDTNATVGALPPHSFRIVFWDGDPSAALDTDVAQAIWDSKPVGIETIGSSSEDAVDVNGGLHAMSFDRATEQETWLEIDVEIDASRFPADGDDQIRQAVVDYVDVNWRIGRDVILSALYGPVFTVSGLIRIAAVRAGFAINPSGTVDLSVAFDEIARADTSRVEVNHV